MLVEALVMLVTAAAPQKAPPIAVAPASLLVSTPAPGYRPDQRAVDNWRSESALALEMSPLAALRRAADAEDREPTRCVKLNNYWCVKRAGWNGEIAADADGHVAFASAEEGAAVAALLLRRYYVDYKRRTARAIVERWAPAQCGAMPMMAPPLARGTTGPAASRAGMARMLPQRIVPMGLAPRGLQNTLRARWLAAHGRGGVGEFGAGSSSVADATADLMPAPSIMEGGGEAPRRRKSARAAPKTPAPEIDALAALPATTPLSTGLAGFSCSGELARIANYAAAVAQGVAPNPNADLRLFDEAGRPTENLARVMANMAAVEIGPDRPRAFLITAAVAQLRRMLQDPAAAALAERRTPPEIPPAEPVAERAAP